MSLKMKYFLKNILIKFSNVNNLFFRIIFPHKMILKNNLKKNYILFKIIMYIINNNKFSI